MFLTCGTCFAAAKGCAVDTQMRCATNVFAMASRPTFRLQGEVVGECAHREGAASMLSRGPRRAKNGRSRRRLLWPGPHNIWFSQGMVQSPELLRSSIFQLDRHRNRWSYLSDVARKMVELLARRENLEPFAASTWPRIGTLTVCRWQNPFAASWFTVAAVH